MASVSGLYWEGMSDLAREWMELGAQWRFDTERDAIVAAVETVNAARAVYSAHRRSGALLASAHVVNRSSGHKVEVVAVSDARHAGFFEYGTEDTDAYDAMIPPAISARARFDAKLEARAAADVRSKS